MILQAFVRGAVVILVAALLAVVLRNRSAAIRHHVWATAVVIQLALLAFIPVLPSFRIPLIPAIKAEIAESPEVPAPNESAPAAELNHTTGTTIRQPTSTPPQDAAAAPRVWQTGDYLMVFWVLGAAIVLVRYLIGTLLMMRLAYKGERIEDGAWLVLAQRTARELGITRPVTMIWGDKVSVPITWGVLYPMILLPKAAQDWPLERRRFVLVHELAHVKRFDALTQLLAQTAAALFWFSPFVWLAEWRMRVERERACDDWVIQHGTEPALYAEELLQMVRSLARRGAQQPAFAALAMARQSEFEGRMLAILDPERPRRVSGLTSATVFALLSLLIAAPLAALDPFAVRVATIPTVELQAAGRRVTPPPAAPIVQAANSTLTQPPAAARQACDFGRQGSGTHALVGSGRIEVKLQREGRCISADISGPVKLSPDERRILAVDPGGYVRVREAVPGRDVELVIDHRSGDAIQRAFSINDRAVNDDGRMERAWLARILPEALAEGAIYPQNRVRHMLASTGLSATIREISALSSVSARTHHFKALLEARAWPAADVQRITDAARASLSSSASDLAAFNRALPTQKRPADSPGAPKTDVELMERILRGISSSYDVRMAMKSQLPRADKPMLLMFARVGLGIGTSFELSNFLVESKEYYLGRKDLELENAWFNAAGAVTSPSGRRAALESALGFATGNERLTLKLLRAATNMSSSVEKALLLTAVANKKLIDTPALRTAFLAQVNTITSGVDRRLVLEALGNN